MHIPRIHIIAGVTFLLFAAVLGLGLFLSDLKQVSAVISNLDPRYLALAIFTTVLSYFFNYLAFRGLARAVGCPVSGGNLFRIAFASATLSYLFSAGGVSGMTMRLLLLRLQGIRTHTTLIISLVSTMLNNVVLLLFVVVGFGRLLMNGSMNLIQQALSALIVVLSGLVVAAAFIGLYNRRILDAVLKHGIRLIERLAGTFPSSGLLRRATTEKLQTFRRGFVDAAALITSRRHKIAVPLLYLVIDWTAAAGVLYFCFLSTGYRIGIGVLAAGFAVGVFVFLISVLPAGLGIMDASMAGLYVSLGVPLEVALISLLAFRVLYYFLPFGAGLVVCGPLLKEARAEAAAGPARD